MFLDATDEKENKCSLRIAAVSVEAVAMRSARIVSSKRAKHLRKLPSRRHRNRVQTNTTHQRMDERTDPSHHNTWWLGCCEQLETTWKRNNTKSFINTQWFVAASYLQRTSSIIIFPALLHHSLVVRDRLEGHTCPRFFSILPQVLLRPRRASSSLVRQKVRTTPLPIRPSKLASHHVLAVHFLVRLSP